MARTRDRRRAGQQSARVTGSTSRRMPDDSAKEVGPRREGARVVTITSDEAGQRIDNYLSRVLKDVPKSRIYRMIRRGEVRLNGGRTKPTVKLAGDDKLRIPPVRRETGPAPAFIGDRQLDALERAIIFEDDRLLVLNKPAGLAVHGGSGVSFGAIEALRRLRDSDTLELVHRLDRETSGCLLIAKRRSTLRSLHRQLREGAIDKFYWLIAHGSWPAELTEVDAPLEKYVAGGGERRVRVSDAGRASRTTFSVEAHADNATLLSAELHTGRTHQIRVHARHVGHSLVGDAKYATAAEQEADRGHAVNRLALHAFRIVLPAAEATPERCFEAPLPADFERLWHSFGRIGAEDG
ncbi:MAG: RluA family pseudouridine synthase [Pseudomonadota bacterium]